MYSVELQTNFYEYQNKNLKNNTSVNRIIFHFDIRGKLYIIRCDKYILELTIGKGIGNCGDGIVKFSFHTYINTPKIDSKQFLTKRIFIIQ